MGRVVFVEKRFKVLAVEDGFIVKRRHGNYEQHSHFKDLKTARIVIKLINRNIVPDSPYLLESIKRLLTQKEFLKMTNGKVVTDINGRLYIEREESEDDKDTGGDGESDSVDR